MLTRHEERATREDDGTTGHRTRRLALVLVAGLVLALFAVAPTLAQSPTEPSERGAARELRVATYNLEDVRTEDVKRTDNPRLRELAATIQRLRPDVILLNEIAYDQPGAPGHEAGDGEGRNAERFVRNYLGRPQVPGLAPVRYDAFAAPSNTGIASGYDLNNNGQTVTEYPPPPPTQPDGSPGPQTAEGRAYGDDSFGFGTFPGQYAMGLLVSPEFEIQRDGARTFQRFLWKDMPGALLPVDPASGESFYSEEELRVFRLSSKSHWDVPVRVPGGEVVHILASHPTPPVFDGPEDRNGRRNHDEIRFLGDYISGASYIYDDEGRRGGLEPGAPFVVLGDLNADPDEGDAFGNPVGEFLLSNPRVNGGFEPLAVRPDSDLDASDTALFGLRADYALPSSDLGLKGGAVRVHTALYKGGPYTGADGAQSPSDHFPVFLDLTAENQCTVTGTDGPDKLVGTEGDDVICGLGGNDTIRGLGGNDRLYGDAGDDEIRGGEGNDRVFGGEGNDRVFGGEGRDTVNGGVDKDYLDSRDGARGNDTLDGTTDGVKDTFVGDPGDRVVG